MAEPSGAYRLTQQDAADLNAAVELPDQPVYDWADVFEDETATRPETEARGG